jgi:hypothetical protein
MKNMKMSHYVEQQWQDRAMLEVQQRRVARIFGVTLSFVAAISLAAYLLRDYWYPYVAPYLHY